MKKIVIAGIIFLSGIITNGYAADLTEHINPYGNLYLFFGYQQSESYSEGQSKNTNKNLLYHIDENSNLGFKFNYEKYNGVFELGLDDIENDRKVQVRKAYGEYDTGIGKLMIGQSWSPYVFFSNELADYYRSKGFGSMYEDPNLQISLSFFNFYVAILKPYVPVNDFVVEQEAATPTSGTITTEYIPTTSQREKTTGLPLDHVDSYIPKFAAGYEFKNSILSISAGGAGNIYFIKNTDDVKFNKGHILSYLGYLNSNLKFYGFTLTVSGGYAVNPANFGIYVQSKGNSSYTGGSAIALENIATGKYEIKDTWNVQGFAELEYKVSDSVICNAGYGYSMVDYPIPGTKKDQAMEYYFNSKFVLGGLIALTPSVSYRDYMKDMAGDKEGKEIVAGVLATISFI